MSALDLNLAAPIRLALIDAAEIVSRLSTFQSEPAVFTRRPVPSEAAYPLILVAPDVSIGDEDTLKSMRPVVTRDVIAYGAQPDDYRTVEELGYLIRALFHSRRFSVVVPNFHVVDIRASGPYVAPADDDMHLGRVVTLRFRLEDLSI